MAAEFLGQLLLLLWRETGRRLTSVVPGDGLHCGGIRDSRAAGQRLQTRVVGGHHVDQGANFRVEDSSVAGQSFLVPRGANRDVSFCRRHDHRQVVQNELFFPVVCDCHPEFPLKARDLRIAVRIQQPANRLMSGPHTIEERDAVHVQMLWVLEDVPLSEGRRQDDLQV